MGNGIRHIRASKELTDVINYIRAKYILDGKKAPPVRKITEFIAKRIDRDELLHECFIKL